MAQRVKNLPAMQRHRRCRFDPWGRKIPGEGNSNSCQYSCLENSTDRGDWRAIVHGVAKSQTQLSDFHFHFSLVAQIVKILWLQCRRPGFNPWVGKIPWRRKMATHSSILAWKIPWTEETGGLQSVESQKSGSTEWLKKKKMYEEIQLFKPPSERYRSKNIWGFWL